MYRITVTNEMAKDYAKACFLIKKHDSIDPLLWINKQCHIKAWIDENSETIYVLNGHPADELNEKWAFNFSELA